jgi:hypothetical protein
MIKKKISSKNLCHLQNMQNFAKGKTVVVLLLVAVLLRCTKAVKVKFIELLCFFLTPMVDIKQRKGVNIIRSLIFERIL